MVATRPQTLGDVVDIKHGYAFLGEYFGADGTHIVLTPGNFTDEGGFKEKGEKEKWYSGPIPPDYVLNEGDLIVAMTEQAEGLLGSSAIVPRSGLYLHNQRLGLVQVKNPAECDSRYLHYLFNSQAVRQQIRAAATGTKVRHTSPTRIGEVKICLPSIAEQRRIAGILSAYDDLIENCRRRIVILEEMARALYREWFVHFRYPGHESIPLVPSPLGPIPQGWQVTTIGQVCGKVTDGSHSSPKSVDEGMPMASSKDLTDWGINLETCRFIAQADYEQLVRNGCKPMKGDVLVTKDGANYLKRILVVKEERDLVLLSSVAILRPGCRMNTHLLTFTLQAPENKGRLMQSVTGAAIPRVILSDFKQFQIICPSRELQTTWLRVAEPIIELIWSLTSKLRNLRMTRDHLLPTLLNPRLNTATVDFANEFAEATR